MNNSLELRTINGLFGKKFHIPSYQRGYRWTEKQVCDLLDDIWEFKETTPVHNATDNKPFYCLQPVVVKQHKEDEWEVIDGQQRLTTIHLILKNLENVIDGTQKGFGKLGYETRKGSESYLKTIEASEKELNVDYYHIYHANKAINDWFTDKANKEGNGSIRAEFVGSFLQNTKVIWYEVKDGTKAIDIFTRINIGKIPLTNAELIKALLLKQGNFINGGQDNVRLKQIQIASEWDKIESTLQDDAFWYFIYEGKQKYATRIEYIFDLMKGKESTHEAYYTFHEFNDDYSVDKNIDRVWLSIKQYFQTFEEWYKDRELYHLIGYLVATGHSVSSLISESKKHNKSQFKDELRSIIGGDLKYDIDELEYKDPEIKPLLLLFNIQTILNNKKSNIRFPFDSYKKENWDIEHIRSVKSDIPKGKKQRSWLEAVLIYFTGTEDQLEQQISIALMGADKELAERIFNLLTQDKITDIEFTELYNSVLDRFRESTDPDDINSISNLTLLDSNTNRSYKNSVFPVKRKTILEKDMNGTFIPLCTRNIFLKAYSSKLDDVMFWQKKDAEDYLNAIKTTLKPFFETPNVE